MTRRTWLDLAGRPPLRDRQPALRRLLYRRVRPRVGVADRRPRPRRRRRRRAGEGPDGGVASAWATPTPQRVPRAGPAGLDDGPRVAHRDPHRRGPPRRRRAAPVPRRRRDACTCRSRSATTSTSTRASTTRPTSGRIFRPDGEPLTPNWKHLPDRLPRPRPARSSSSGTDVVRPVGAAQGRRREPAPVFGPSIRLDIEAELGFVVGGSSDLGEPVGDRRRRRPPVRRRPPQRLERPRHPGLGVRAARPVPRQVVRAPAISAWVTPLEALGSARVALPGQDPEPLPYLRGSGDGGIRAGHPLRGRGQRHGGHPPGVPRHVLVPRPDAGPPDGQRRHRCAPGDLFGSGTISGAGPGHARFVPGAGVERHASRSPSTTGRRAASSRTATRCHRAPGRRARTGGRIGLGDCVGTVRPAR